MARSIRFTPEDGSKLVGEHFEGTARRSSSCTRPLPNVRAAIEIPGVAHLPSLEAPDAVAALIAEAIAAEQSAPPVSSR